MSLSVEAIERYSRQILLQQVGGAGQEKLLASRVLIVGAGGLGAPASFYLAAAGVGTIGLVDGDEVDLTNLQRQIVHFTADLGKLKVESAAAKLKAINPAVQVETLTGPQRPTRWTWSGATTSSSTAPTTSPPSS